MTFDDVVAIVRDWCADPVLVVLEPDHSVMRGRLHEIDSSGIDGALFAVADEADPASQPTGVAVALFRDAFASARRADDELRVRQGRVEIIVRRAAATGAPGSGR